MMCLLWSCLVAAGINTLSIMTTRAQLSHLCLDGASLLLHDSVLHAVFRYNGALCRCLFDKFSSQSFPLHEAKLFCVSVLCKFRQDWGTEPSDGSKQRALSAEKPVGRKYIPHGDSWAPGPALTDPDITVQHQVQPFETQC
jgi:hypothetical protein